MSHLHGVISDDEAYASQMERPLIYAELERLTGSLINELQEYFANHFEDKAVQVKLTQVQVSQNAKALQKLYESVKQLKLDIQESAKQLEEDHVVIREVADAITRFYRDHLILGPPGTEPRLRNSDREDLYRIYDITMDNMDKFREVPKHLEDLRYMMDAKKDYMAEILDLHERILRYTDKNITRLNELTGEAQIGLEKATRLVITQDRATETEKRLCRCKKCTEQNGN